MLHSEKKVVFVLFSCFPWHFYPDKGWVSLLLTPIACIWWFQLIFPFFGWYVIPVGHFPQKSLNGNPDFSLLPITRPYLLLPLTHGPPPLYWLGASGWCLSLVLALLPYESMACLVFMRLPLLTGLFGPAAHSAACFNSLCHGWVIGSSFFASRFFFGLGIAWVWAFSSLI